MLSARSGPLPPQSVEAERAILGAVLIEGIAGYRKLTGARADLFWTDHNRETFAAMQRLAERGDAIDIVTVTEELRAVGALERVGGMAFLALMQTEGCILNNLGSYEKILGDVANRRLLLQLGERLTYESQNGTTTAAIALIAETALAELRGRAPRPVASAPTELAALLAHRFPPRMDYVGHGILLKRSVMVLGGKTFLGKSLLLDNLCLQRARGLAWLGHPTDPGTTLILSSEIKLDGAQSRFATMLAGSPDPIPEGVIHVHDERGVKVDTPAGLDRIAGWIQDTGATILRLDPLAKYMSTEENSTLAMGRVVDALELLADRYDVGVIVVHHEGHASKDSGRTGGDRLRGSTALYAAADTVGMLSKDGDDGYRLEWELRHARAPEPMRLTRDAALWYHPAGLSDEFLTIGKIVAVTPMTHKALTGAIQVDLGVSRETSKRRVQAAVAAQAIQKDADGRYYPGPAFTGEGSRAHGGSLGD